MMEGCLESPKTSAPRRKTRVATYWFAPLMRLTTAMTAATPITTPISVKTLRSLCAQRLEAEIATASAKFIVVGRGIEPGDTNAPHPNIRPGGLRNYVPTCLWDVSALSKQKNGSRKTGSLGRYRLGLRLEGVGHSEAHGARELVSERLPVLRT